jgi:hypothetical protein
MSTLNTRKIKHDSSVVDNIILDSNGRVGIGASNPSRKLQVQEAGQANISLYNSVNATELRLIADTSGIFVQTNTNHPLYLATNNSAAQLIVNTNGTIITPYQPAVEVSRTSNFAVSNNEAVGTVVPFNSETLDVTNSFDHGGTNRFTAPIAGRYQFHWSYGANINSNTVYRTYLWINGTRRDDSQLRNDNNKTGSAYNWGSRTLILSLATNDYVELRASSDNGTEFYSDNNLRISLGIRLVG